MKFLSKARLQDALGCVTASLVGIIGLSALAFLSVAKPANAANLNIGLNFTASTFGQNNNFFYPPDTMGAVGQNQIVELINGGYTVFDKTTGAVIQRSTLDQFWTNSGVTPTNSSYDPRILYDSSSQRWFAAALDNANQANNFLVAVSNSSDLTSGWKAFKIDSDSTNQNWADFTTMGLNANGVYVAANMFSIGANSTGTGTTILTLPKSDFIAGSIANYTINQNLNPNTTGYTIQPVVSTSGSATQELLYSAYNSNNFKRSTLSGSINSPTLNTSGGFIPVTSYNAPTTADQPGTAPNIDAGDSRFSSNLILQNGYVWGVQSVVNNGRSALRWFELDSTTNTKKQEGLISDSNLDFYYGSIAVNNSGNVVIGFSGSGANQYASSYAVLGQTVNGITTFNTPQLLKAGVASYQIPNSTENRWGDYSATVVDPVDSNTFWTFQEWASSSGTWSTQVTQVSVQPVPEPLTIIGSTVGLGFGAFFKKRYAKNLKKQ